MLGHWALGVVFSPTNGGQPGFALRKFMQLKVLIYPEFSNKVSSIVLSKLFWGCSSNYIGGLEFLPSMEDSLVLL